MAAPLFFPRFRAFDQAGAPLVGGKVYAYVATTATPQDTYTDSSLATPNANPVILDANGEASIWVGDGLYKFILKDATDVVQWTVDSVTESGVAGTGGGGGGGGSFQPIAVFFDAGNTGAALSIDWANGQQQQFTLTANATVTIGNPTLPGWYTLKAIEDATGSRTLAWAGAQYSASRWIGNGAAPAVSGVIASVTLFDFFWDGSKWYQVHLGVAGRRNTYTTRAPNTAGAQTIATGVTATLLAVPFLDPYNEFNATSGVFTAKVSGLYQLDANVKCGLTTAGNSITITLQIASTNITLPNYYPTSFNGQTVSVHATYVFNMAAGDTAFASLTNGTSADVTMQSTSGVVLQVTRIGDAE